VAKKSHGGNGVTVFDVAKHAGVSIATVSRALSGSRPMSDQLRDRVRQSADALGYQVNLVGRALRQKKTSTLGLIIPDLENPFFSSLAQRISRRFAASEVDVLVASADNDCDQETRAVQSFLGRQVDALVMVPTDEAESASALHLANDAVPTIQFDRQVPDLPITYIGCDNSAGMSLIDNYITEHIDTDEQPVMLIGGGKSSSSGRERSSSLMSLRDLTEHFEGSFSFTWGQQAAKQILAQGYRRATIVAAADVIALGVISWLTSAGYRVPEDFRIIGFDDIGVAYLAHPPLTTIRQPLEGMTEAIERAIYGKAEGQTIGTERFAPQLVVRQSG